MLKIGFGQKKIELTGGRVSLFGQWEERLTDETMDPLYAVAMVVESESARTVWVSFDLCEISEHLERTVEKHLKKTLPGFQESQLILSATHIHTGPCVFVRGFTSLMGDKDAERGVQTPQQACEDVALAAEKAVLEAYAALEPGRFDVSVAYVQTGVCRRVTYKDGTARMYGNANGPDFAGMEGRDGGPSQLLYAYNLAGKLIGIVADVPCTAQCDEMAMYVTADYFGVARPIVEKAFGSDVKLLALVRAAGDLSPHPIADTYPSHCARWGRDLSVFMGKRVGKMIVDHIGEITSTIENDAPHAQIDEVVNFPAWVPTEEEYEAAKRYLAAYTREQIEKGEGDRIEYSNCLARVRRHDEHWTTIPGRVAAVRLGDVAFITSPFELFIEFADRIRMACPKVHVFDVELVGDCIGYLPTRHAVAGGHYSAVILSAPTGPDGGDLLVERSVAMIGRLFPEG